MESRVLPSKTVSVILAENFVCVKVNVDKPSPAAAKILEQVTGDTLPFYAYTTPDGKFISGTSGFRDVERFRVDLEGVLKHDSLKVSSEAEKKLAAAVEQASKDLDAKRYAAVVMAARDAESVRGFSDSKKKLHQLVAQAIKAGRVLLEDADTLLKAEKHVEALAIVRRVQTDFRGTELDGPAKAAEDAIERVHPSPGPDTVLLKDGTSVNGKIVARAEEMILVQVPGGKMVKIQKNQIAEIKTETKR